MKPAVYHYSLPQGYINSQAPCHNLFLEDLGHLISRRLRGT